ncbi:hypothetical protein niasHT_018067 [Heterodera trifolii]|uniref:BTB domain-containing protein n=1 Tax=Heterodera trifolii TaxID=157864 RepID=A0ABD2LKN6_9BILA
MFRSCGQIERMYRREMINSTINFYKLTKTDLQKQTKCTAEHQGGKTDECSLKESKVRLTNKICKMRMKKVENVAHLNGREGIGALGWQATLPSARERLTFMLMNDTLNPRPQIVEREAFEALLTFLYTDDIQCITKESVMSISYTGACVNFLENCLNGDNAFMLLSKARFYDEQ